MKKFATSEGPNSRARVEAKFIRQICGGLDRLWRIYPPLDLSAVFLVRRFCGGVAEWRTGGPAHKFVNNEDSTPIFY